MTAFPQTLLVLAHQRDDDGEARVPTYDAPTYAAMVYATIMSRAIEDGVAPIGLSNIIENILSLCRRDEPKVNLDALLVRVYSMPAIYLNAVGQDEQLLRDALANPYWGWGDSALRDLIDRYKGSTAIDLLIPIAISSAASTSVPFYAPIYAPTYAPQNDNAYAVPRIQYGTDLPYYAPENKRNFNDGVYRPDQDHTHAVPIPNWSPEEAKVPRTGMDLYRLLVEAAAKPNGRMSAEQFIDAVRKAQKLLKPGENSGLGQLSDEQILSIYNQIQANLTDGNTLGSFQAESFARRLAEISGVNPDAPLPGGNQPAKPADAPIDDWYGAAIAAAAKPSKGPSSDDFVDAIRKMQLIFIAREALKRGGQYDETHFREIAAGILASDLKPRENDPNNQANNARIKAIYDQIRMLTTDGNVLSPTDIARITKDLAATAPLDPTATAPAAGTASEPIKATASDTLVPPAGCTVDDPTAGRSAPVHVPLGDERKGDALVANNDEKGGKGDGSGGAKPVTVAAADTKPPAAKPSSMTV